MAPSSFTITSTLRTKAQVICARSKENVSVLRYFITPTWSKKAKLTVDFVAFPSVKFRETWHTGTKFFTLVGARFSGKTMRPVFTQQMTDRETAFHRSEHPCIKLAHLKFKLTYQDSAGGENSTLVMSSHVNRNGIEPGNFSHWRWHYSEKCETFCSSKLSIWRQKWFLECAWQLTCTSRRGSPAWVIFEKPLQFVFKLNSGILKLTIKRG